MKKTKEINYRDAAKLLGCSGRNVRRILKRHGIEPIRRGHRTVTIPVETIFRLQLELLPL